MRDKLLLFLIISILFSCTTTKYVVRKVTEYKVPSIQCPIPKIPVYEFPSENDTEKEYLDKLTNNLDKASKYIQTLKQSIKCFEENLKVFKEEVKKDK